MQSKNQKHSSYSAYRKVADIAENYFYRKVCGENDAGSIPADKLKYFQAEARYFRAYNYFKMVVQYGGVPLNNSPPALPDCR